MSPPLKLILLAFVSTLTHVAPAQEPANSHPSQPIADENDKRGSIETGGISEDLFIKPFVQRRKEHLVIIKKIREMESYEKRYKMISILAENSLNVIETSRGVIEGLKFVPEDKELLKNMTIRHALSTVLENYALFGDAILQLPDITRRVMKSQKNLNSSIQWGLTFANETRHLLDGPTITMFDLVRQELKLIPRHPNYTNPYWPKDNEAEVKEDDKKKAKKIAKERKKSRGPQMVNIEL